MPYLERVGIESDIESVVPQLRLVRARFRIDNNERPIAERFPEGDWLDVRVTARLYRKEDAAAGRLDVPIAESPEEKVTARVSWSVVDLLLPLMPPGEYSVVAKVFSGDDRYRKLFTPSNCRFSVVRFPEGMEEGGA